MIRTIQIVLLSIISMSILGQSSQSFNYQSAVRGDNGNLLINQPVALQFTIRSGSASGPVEYEETHSVTTNDFGMVNLRIGDGSAITGNFSTISWSAGDHFLQVDLDAGNGYVNMGTQQLVSVPYALYSDEAAMALEMELEHLNDLDLSTAPQNGQVLQYNGSLWTAQDLSVVMDLEDLSNVSSAPTSGEFLQWDGSQWTGQSISVPVDLEDLSNVSAAPSSGEVLQWDGSEWTNNQLETSKWSESGSNIYYDGGNVGIGTSSPSSALDVDGSAQISGNVEANGELRANANASGNLSYIRFRDGSGSSGPRIFHSTFPDNIQVRGVSQFSVDGEVTADTIHSSGNIKADGDMEANGIIRINANATQSLSYIRFRDQTGLSAPRIYHNASDSTLNFRGMKVTFDSPPGTDSIGLRLLGSTNNYIRQGNWMSGVATSNVSGAISGDYVMVRFGNGYGFWSSYFRPLQDDHANLGTSSGRWNNVYATNGTIITSDRREKFNITTTNYGLSEVMQMKPVNFQWKSKPEEGNKVGFVAQDLLEIIPEVVVTEEKVENRETGKMEIVEAENLGVYYSDLIPVLTKAIQEQQEIITTEKEKNEELKKKVEKQQEEIEELLRSLNENYEELQSRIEELEEDK